MHLKFHRYLLLFTLGFFLLPTLTYACGTTSEKKCCKKEITTKSDKKKCCTEDPSQTEDKGCDGKCGHSNCTSTSTTSTFAVFNAITFELNAFDFSKEKQEFYDEKTFISTGFSSLWLIPKIG